MFSWEQGDCLDPQKGLEPGKVLLHTKQREEVGNKKKIIEDVDDRMDVKVVFNYPFKGIRDLIKKEGSTSQAKWAGFVKVVAPFPGHSQEFPIIGVNGDDSES